MDWDCGISCSEYFLQASDPTTRFLICRTTEYKLPVISKNLFITLPEAECVLLMPRFVVTTLVSSGRGIHATEHVSFSFFLKYVHGKETFKHLLSPLIAYVYWSFFRPPKRKRKFMITMTVDRISSIKNRQSLCVLNEGRGPAFPLLRTRAQKSTPRKLSASASAGVEDTAAVTPPHHSPSRMENWRVGVSRRINQRRRRPQASGSTAERELFQPSVSSRTRIRVKALTPIEEWIKIQVREGAGDTVSSKRKKKSLCRSPDSVGVPHESTVGLLLLWI